MVQLLYGLNFTFAKTVMNENLLNLLVLYCYGLMEQHSLLAYQFFLPKQKIEKKDYIKFFVAALFGVVINMLFFL